MDRNQSVVTSQCALSTTNYKYCLMMIAVNTDVGRDSVPEPLQTVSVSSPSLRYSYAPSDRQRIACNWKLADCYETATVLCRQSDISVSIIKFT